MDERQRALEVLSKWRQHQASKQQSPAARRKLLGRLAFVFASIFIVLVGLRAAMDPWSLPLPGMPALTGEWVGTLVSPQGQRFGVYFDIKWDAGGGCPNCGHIGGGAQSCRADGDARQYTLKGKPQTWRGEVFTLGATQSVDDAPGLRLYGMDGRWLADELHITATLASIGVKSGANSNPDTTRPVAWTMRRGTRRDFTVLCARITAK
ncbi:MAG: hypothetical protein GC149_01590 [Gammaproteobacteria bacterium]|nr:hypothetical protein [Gammaproteobacteria bacterium]